MIMSEIEYINKAIEDIKENKWECAYEKLEWASLINPNNYIPCLLKAVILNRKHWEERLKYEKLSGMKFSDFLDDDDK